MKLKGVPGRPKFGVAVMPILDARAAAKEVVQAAGKSGHAIDASTLVGFCHALSSRLLKASSSRDFPDVMTFAYYARKANVRRVMETIPNCYRRRGYGAIVHITPSNIPVNFAFSMLMGLLSGNVNFIRLPSKHFDQTDMIIDAIDGLAGERQFYELAARVRFFRCERDSPALAEMIGACGGLVVWGGDETVTKFKSMAKPASAVELYFPNKVSSAILHAETINVASDKEIEQLALRFFNDTYLVDQNACSSPGIVFWQGTSEGCHKGQRRFWKAVDQVLSQKYYSSEMLMIEKHLDLMRMVQHANEQISLVREGDLIWRFDNHNLRQARLRFGNFLEIGITSFEEIPRLLRPNEQTLTYFGIDPVVLFDSLSSYQVTVDRIVPVGHALAMGMHWDGKNILSHLSREIEIV